MRGSSQGEHFGGPHDGPPEATQRASRFVSAPQGGPAPAACFGHKSGLLARPPWPLKTARGALKTAFARRVITAPQSAPKAAVQLGSQRLPPKGQLWPCSGARGDRRSGEGRGGALQGAVQRRTAAPSPRSVLCACRRARGRAVAPSGCPGKELHCSARVLHCSAPAHFSEIDPDRSKNTALGVLRTPGGVLGTCFAL